MYHQFMKLANIDITQEPMEVGPTTHYMMGGVRVDADSQMSTVPGLFAAGECAAGLHGANRLGGNSLSDLLVFGKRAGQYAAAFARENARAHLDPDEVATTSRMAVAPFERTGSAAEDPYAVQQALQELMQDSVGIVRRQSEMEGALEGIARLRERAGRTAVPGNRAYNPGWHTALDLEHMLTVSEAITRAALERTESRGAHFRDDFPDKDATWSRANLVIAKGADAQMQHRREPVRAMPEELRKIIEEMK
jgi:succinate dehydrogenase / fumarate reductase flavoprotein subunit